MTLRNNYHSSSKFTPSSIRENKTDGLTLGAAQDIWGQDVADVLTDTIW